MRSYAKKLMDTAILAGQIMLECNAESYRVEETMNYILSTSNFETCEAFAMATGIFATLDDDCIDSITEIRRVPNRDTNLNRIYKVNAALFGATPIELVIASVAAIIMPFVYKLDPKLKLGTFVLNLLSIIPAIVIIIMIQKHFVPDARIGISIVGLIMPAVPGTAITNAIRDTLRGDYNSGAARAIEAFVTALSVAIAVALGLVLAGGANPL